MKKKLFILSLLFTSFFSYQIRSQETNVKWGPVSEKEESKSVITRVIGEDDEYLYLLREIPPFLPRTPLPNKLMLEKCNKAKIEKVFCKELSMPEIGKKTARFEALMMINKKLVLFTSVYNKGNKTDYLYMQSVDSEGKPDPQYKELDKIANSDQEHFFSLSLSNDGNKILITNNFANPENLYSMELTEEFIEKKFSYKLIDSELNITSSKLLKFPKKNEDFVILDYKLNNDGSIYMLAKFFKRKVQKAERLRPASKYGVFYYSNENDEIKDFDLSFDDKYLTDVACKIDKADNLICLGFYATQDDYNVMGTFCVRIDKKTKSVTSKEFQDFENEFSDNCLGEERRSAIFMSYNYNLKIILKDDGGAVLVGEAYNNRSNNFIVEKTFSNEVPKQYEYRDLIAVNIKPNGSIIWHKKIAKNQATYDAGFNSSYFMGISKNKLFFVFNDNEKNLIDLKKKVKTMDKAEKSIPVIVTVNLDQAGALTKKQLFKTEDSKNILCPRINFRVSDHELIILKAKRNSYNFGKINF